jgi:hypothetical protein
MEVIMKVLTLKRSLDDPTEIEVHLEIWTTLRTVAEWVFWYVMFMFLGMALERAYLLTRP